MPYTGGIFALLASYKATTRTPIPSASHNAVLEDLQVAQNFPRPVPAGGTGANTADGAAKALALISNKILAGVSAVSGSADEISIDTDQNFTALTNLVVLAFRPTATSVSGGTTVALDGLDAKAVRKIAASGDVDISTRDMIAGGIYTLVYDPDADGGDGAFILVNPESTADEAVGTGRYDLRNMGPNYLRRDGGIYLKVDYPDLALLLPPLPDGVNWSTITTPLAASGDVRTIITTPSGFMAAHDDGTNTKIVTSTDGANWVIVATINAFRAASLAYGAGIYVCTDANGYFSKSADGISWSAPVLLSGVSTDFFSGVAFGAGLFVAVGGNTSNNPRVFTSPDAVTWTVRTSGLSNGVILNNVKFVNNTFVAVGSGGNLATSTSGTSWTARTTGGSVALRDVTYGAGLYVIAGGTGSIYTSSNLASWFLQTTGTGSDLYGVTYSSAGFSAVGVAGVSRISTNGTTWTATATGVSNSLYCIITDPSNASKYYVTGSTAKFLAGLRTLPTQFQVPNDGANQWIRALP